MRPMLRTKCGTSMVTTASTAHGTWLVEIARRDGVAMSRGPYLNELAARNAHAKAVMQVMREWRADQ